MIAGIAGSLSSLKTELDTQISQISVEALHQKHLIRSISDRVTFLEDKYDADSYERRYSDQSANQEKLQGEIKYLENQMHVLKVENENLKNRNKGTSNTRSKSNPKIKALDCLCESVRSFSPISSPNPIDASNFDLIHQIHSLRLDSDGSQTHQLAIDLFKDKPLQADKKIDGKPIKTSRQLRPDSQVGQPIWKVVNPLSFLSKNMSSVLNDSQESISHHKNTLQDTRHKQTGKIAEDSNGERRTGFKTRLELDRYSQDHTSIKNVRNFDDFRQTLISLKLTLDTSHCTESKKQPLNGESKLKDLLRKYTQLDERMIKFYKQKVSFVYDEPDNNSFLDFSRCGQDQMESSRRHSTPSLTNCSQIILLKKLQSVIRQSKLCEYNVLLQNDWKACQNADELLKEIEQEMARRESEFTAIEKQLRVKI